ncbi:type II toxin-antitoxin system VapB family antitoxin [Sphingomonas oligophenolica]|uniref:Transcription factor n=1 Tax=Sphingomonas oligophenolica TaxID=301154 RepID=A0A502CJS1_9SPHN|nr:type II toxin-antitoxin system VapB family antitoxin [Sphingomonas oligophenolica]TPG12339.1 transcription factor [Sphingomonas oligophenolica]
MASLFIKDTGTAALATEIAEQLGTTKTEAVRRGLQCLAHHKATEQAAPTGSTVDWLRDYRARHPLPDREALKLGKAFFDSLSDEEDDLGPWLR